MSKHYHSKKRHHSKRHCSSESSHSKKHEHKYVRRYRIRYRKNKCGEKKCCLSIVSRGKRMCYTPAKQTFCDSDTSCSSSYSSCYKYEYHC